MSNLSELNSYILQLQQRLRLGVWLRGVAIFTAAALTVTVALVLVLNRFAFPAVGVTGARFALLAALFAAAVFGVAFPLVRLTRGRAVREAEVANPELEQRLTTFYEAERKGGDPFLELLAADTLARTQYAKPSMLVPDNCLFALAGAGLACLSVLVWMIAAGPGYLGYGASLLWSGPKKNAISLYAIVVTPGDVAVRRNSDQLITAQVRGLHPDRVQLFAHYHSSSGWETAAMQVQPAISSDAAYQFVFAGLPENVEYYVAAGPLVSPHYKVRVVDLPSVKDIRVTYRYPKWTGMKPVIEEHSGDLRAIEGTGAAIEVEMAHLDHPLKEGQLILDGGQVIQLTQVGGNTGDKYQGSIHMEKDGAYHVAAASEGQQVRLSEDYFISTDKAMPPEIAIARPGGDYRASPIEEVTLGVKAADQFGLNDVHLHYSVNGGADHDVSMLKAPGTKTADGSYTLPLEDFKLVPGDLVSLYATARDGHAEARTNISFVQVDPFEREFSQSQQGGGGGGGQGNQNNQTEISKREKELIAATWKQQNEKNPTTKDAAATGKFLSDAQQKLRDQVLALSARMQSRDLSEANEEFNGFNKDMQVAAAAMLPSADKLKGMQWKDAIPLEQKALQALLRAEATFRQIQVAFGQSGGGGGGGSDSAGRDLASLFDLELDTEKNQYETAQTASPAEQHQKDVEDALQKLDALARRQEELANQQRNPQQSFQDRWQQEMLRREAEQLQRQMEELAKNSQQSQQGSSESASGQQSSKRQQSSTPRGESGSQAGSQASQQREDEQLSGSSANRPDQRVTQALSRLQQADEAMKRSGSPQQSSDAARRAADQLRQAESLLAGTQQQLASGKMDSMVREAGRLRQEEHAQAGEINKLASQSEENNPMDMDGMTARIRERDRLAEERQQLSNDLSKLQGNLRDSARALAPTQPGVAKKLRDALTEMDESDLDNHMQRTADWLRRGINPNANGTESQIEQGLGKLDRQLQQAQKGIGEGKQGQGGATQGDETAALDGVERLRNQIEAMAGSRGSNGKGSEKGSEERQSQSRQNGQNGRQRSADSSSQGGEGRESGRNANGGQQRGSSLSQGTQNQPGSNGGREIQRGGDVGGQRGEVRSGSGGVADGAVWDNINTGKNHYGQVRQPSALPDSSSNPADKERAYQQSLRELNQLRQVIHGDPEAKKEVEELTRQMQRLDPGRFPGNPAMVEQMHREVLSAVDRLELQLQRDGVSTEVRAGKPYAVPVGYQNSVADYYRRLSKNP